MRHLTLSEIVVLHGRLIQSSGGTQVIRDLGGLESAEAMILAVASGDGGRDALMAWVRSRLVPRAGQPEPGG